MINHPIPQNIMDVEFKIVGALSLRQFMYVAVGFGLGYVVVISKINPFVKYPLALLPSVFSLAVAFLPIDDRPMDVWLVNFFKAIYVPQDRVWKKEPKPLSFMNVNPPKVKIKQITLVEGVDVVDRKVVLQKYEDKIAQTPIKHRRENHYGEVLTEREEIRLNKVTNLFSNTNVGLGKDIILNPEKVNLKEKLQIPNRGIKTNKLPPNAIIKKRNKSLEKTLLANLRENPHETFKRTEVKLAEINMLKSAILNLHIEKEAQKKTSIGNSGKKKTSGIFSSIFHKKIKEESPTITSKLKASRVIDEKLANSPSTSHLASKSYTANIVELSKEREKLEREIQASQTKLSKEMTAPKEHELFEELKKQNELLLKELQNTQKSIEFLKAEKNKTDFELSKKNQALETEKNINNSLMGGAYSKSDRMDSSTSQVAPPPPVTTEAKREDSVYTAPTQNPVVITSKPDLVNGYVYDTGGKLLSGAIIIIYDETNAARWASRSNEIGQFLTINPLSRGRYTVKCEKVGFKFDTIGIDVAGSVLEPIYFRAKKV